MKRQGRTQTVAPPITSIQVLVVTCGGVPLAIPADLVRGLREPADVGPEGTVVTSHDVYPHTDLHSRLGLARPSPTLEERLVLCSREHLRQAVIVDVVLGLTDIEHARIQPLPAHFTGPERDWFAGLLVDQNRVIPLLNAGWLLRDDKGAPNADRAVSGPTTTLLSAPPLDDGTVIDGTAWSDQDWEIVGLGESQDDEDRPQRQG